MVHMIVVRVNCLYDGESDPRNICAKITDSIKAAGLVPIDVKIDFLCWSQIKAHYE